jgi:hypothetical protein
VVLVLSSSLFVVGLISLIYAVGTSSSSNTSAGVNAAANILLLASYIFVRFLLNLN